MLPDIGGTELLVIAAVALIVVGPKDLPVLLRKVGQFVARMRAMANEFRASFDEMARQSELDELRKEVEAMRRGQVDTGLSGMNSDVQRTFDDIDASLKAGQMQMHPPMSHQWGDPEAAAAGAADVPAPEPAPESLPEAPVTPELAAEPGKPARKPRAPRGADEGLGEGEAPAPRKRAPRKSASTPATDPGSAT